MVHQAKRPVNSMLTVCFEVFLVGQGPGFILQCLGDEMASGAKWMAHERRVFAMET